MSKGDNFLTLRVSGDALHEIEGVAKKNKLSKSAAARLLVERGLVALKEGYLSESLVRSLARVSRTAAYNRKAINTVGEITILNNTLLHALVNISSAGDKKINLHDLLAKSRIDTNNYLDGVKDNVSKGQDHLSLAIHDHLVAEDIHDE